MRLPRLPYTGNKIIKSTIEWLGINRQSQIRDNEFSATTNLSTKNFPLISPRPPREKPHTLTAGNALFSALKLAWVDGTEFKYNNVKKGDVTDKEKYMVDFNGNIIIFPDNKRYDYVSDKFASFGTGTYPNAGSVPDIDYACTLDNRIWGVKGDNIYATALGKYDDWTTFAGVNTDAYAIDTGTNGDFTGIASYKGAVFAFKEDRIFKLFGNNPSNYQLIEISRMGCTNHKSICEINGTLLWLSPQGVCAYTGGAPEVISENLNDSYVSGVGGGNGRYYYLSLYSGSTYSLYVFDTWKGVWMQEDNLSVKDFALLDGFVYALSDNKIYKFNSGNERVSWEAITKEYTEEINNKKGHSELMFRVDLEAGSALQVYVRVDNGSFSLVKSYSTNNLSSFRVVVPVRRADHFQIKLVGIGEGKIHQMTRKFNVGSEV